eukprot:4886898-Prymnesium_polylepis.1
MGKPAGRRRTLDAERAYNVRVDEDGVHPHEGQEDWLRLESVGEGPPSDVHGSRRGTRVLADYLVQDGGVDVQRDEQGRGGGPPVRFESARRSSFARLKRGAPEPEKDAREYRGC